MNPFRMTVDEAWVIRFERRSGRWVLAPRRRPGPWLLLLEWAAVTMGACAILMGGLFAGLYQARPDFDVQSKAFADDAVDAIAASLNTSDLFARASPDFIASASEALRADFRHLAALGPGGMNEGCRGAAAVEPLGVYSPLTARYTCKLRSPHKQTVAVLSLARDLGNWKITGFYVSPPRLVGP